MSALHELQQAFASAILDGHADELAPRVRSNRLAGAERVQIYRNNAYVSLTEALADVYPVVGRLVGTEYFAQLARAYIRAHPPRSGNLHDFGRELPLFVRALPEAHALPYLADVAALEWSYHKVFHAADAGPLDLDRLATVPEAEHGRLRLTLHPATRLVASRYPIYAIWEANQDDERPVPTVDLDSGPDYVMAARRNLITFVARLAPGDYALAAELASGATLARACGAALAADPAIDVGDALGRLVASGTIVGFHHF